jgi:hypothetical protein
MNLKRLRVSLSAVVVVLAAVTVVRGHGSTYTFSTLAGDGSSGIADGTGAEASLSFPWGLA